MSPCFTFTHKSKFTYSRTKISNFTFTQVPYFTHSRVKKSHFMLPRQKKGLFTRSRKLLGRGGPIIKKFYVTLPHIVILPFPIRRMF